MSSQQTSPRDPAPHRDLWNHELAWRLLQSASAMGERAAGLEPSSRGGSLDFDHHTSAQLGGRWLSEAEAKAQESFGFGRRAAAGSSGREGEVARLRRIDARWNARPADERAVLLAHYLGTPRAPAEVRARFGGGRGGLAGVVVEQWLERARRNAVRAAERPIDGIRDDLALVLEDLEPLEVALAVVRRPLPRRRAEWGERLGAALVRALLDPIARPLRSRRDALLAQEATLLAPLSVDAALDELVKLAELEPWRPEVLARQAPLRAKARAAAVAAHRAWRGDGDLAAAEALLDG